MPNLIGQISKAMSSTVTGAGDRMARGVGQPRNLALDCFDGIRHVLTPWLRIAEPGASPIVRPRSAPPNLQQLSYLGPADSRIRTAVCFRLVTLLSPLPGAQEKRRGRRSKGR